MYGIFMESLVIFKLYTGMRFLIILFALSWIYLLFAERDKRLRLLFVAAPPLILLAFLCPVSRKLFVAAGLDGQTYYRILWTVPMGVITAYGMCRVFEAHRRIGLVVSALLVICCGSFVYKSGYIQKAENLYHIPNVVIRICDLIAPEGEKGQVMVVVPEELVYFVRQYNAGIRMPYGREMVEGQWDYYNEVHSAMEETEIIDLEKLMEATRKEYCQYIVINPVRQVKGDPEELGLQFLADIEGYRVYKDPVAAAEVESWQQYYEEDQD